MEEKRIELRAEPRTLTGKRARYLRRQGLVPGNIYGHGKPSTAVQVEAKALQSVLARAGINSLVTLLIDGATRSAMLREIKRSPRTGLPLHVDLQEVALDEPIRARLPIVLTGESPAVRAGYVLVRPLDHVNVEGLPARLPHALHIDVSGLTNHDAALRVRDLEVPDGVRVLEDPDEMIVTLAVGAVEEVAPTPAEEEAAEERAAATEAPGESGEEKS